MSVRSDAQAAYDALPHDDRAALQGYRARNGAYWKSRLCALWATAALDRYHNGAALKRVRNAVGPSGLYLIRF